MKRAIQSILAILLIGLLMACGREIAAPSNQILKQAIALEVDHTQTALSRQLQLSQPSSSSFSVSHIAIKQKTPLMIENLPGVHLQGTYDLGFKLSGRQITQHQNDFDLYLQRQKDEKSWQLAHPNTDGAWSTELVGLLHIVGGE
jgi:hypothetical protein